MDLNKIVKKRGRKPKEIFKPSEPSNFQISEEAVILHLNIKNNKDSILNIEDEFVKYNPSINIPTPFVPEDLENAWHQELKKKFRSLFLQLVSDKKKQKELKKNLKSFAQPNATKKIVEEIIELLWKVIQ